MTKTLALSTPYPDVVLPGTGAFLTASECVVVNLFTGQKTPLRPGGFATEATTQKIAEALATATPAVKVEVEETLMAGPYIGPTSYTLVLGDGRFWIAGDDAQQIFAQEGWTASGGVYSGSDLTYTPPA